jgi:hypothetical protein
MRNTFPSKEGNSHKEKKMMASTTTEQAPEKTWIKFGGWAAIISALFYFGTIAVNLMGANRLAYAWLGIIATLLVVPMTIGLYHKLAGAKNRLQAQVAVVAMSAGWALSPEGLVCSGP